MRKGDRVVVIGGQHRGRVATVLKVTYQFDKAHSQVGVSSRALRQMLPSSARAPPTRTSKALRRGAFQRVVVLQGVGQRRVDYKPSGGESRTTLATHTPINASNVMVLDPGTHRPVRTARGRRVASARGGGPRRFVDAAGRALSRAGRPLGRAVRGGGTRQLDALNRPLDAHGERLVDDSPAGRGWPYRLDDRGRPLDADGAPVLLRYAKGAPWGSQARRRAAHPPRIIEIEAPPVIHAFARPAPVRTIPAPRGGRAAARALTRRNRGILLAPVASSRATPLPWTRVRPPVVQAGVGAATFPDLRRSTRPAYGREAMHALAPAPASSAAERSGGTALGKRRRAALAEELERERRWEAARERERLLDTRHWTPSRIDWRNSTTAAAAAPSSRRVSSGGVKRREVTTDRLPASPPRARARAPPVVRMPNKRNTAPTGKKKATRKEGARKEEHESSERGVVVRGGTTTQRETTNILEASRRAVASVVGRLLPASWGLRNDQGASGREGHIPQWTDPANQSPDARLRRHEARVLAAGRRAQAKQEAKLGMDKAKRDKPPRWRRLFARTKARLDAGEFKRKDTRAKMRDTLDHLKGKYLDRQGLARRKALDRKAVSHLGLTTAITAKKAAPPKPASAKATGTRRERKKTK